MKKCFLSSRFCELSPAIRAVVFVLLGALLTWGILAWVDRDHPIFYGDDGVMEQIAMDYDMVRSSAAPMATKALSSSYGIMESGNAFQNTTVDFERKIIRSGSLQVEVEDTEEAVGSVKSIISSQEGFVDNLNVWEWQLNQKRADLTLRVPSDKFDETVGLLKNLGSVQSESENTSDVTQTWQDNDARLKNLKAREEQVRSFFDKSKEVTDTLDIFRELENIRYEIESLERQQSNLDKQTTYSQIYLSLVPEIEITSLQDAEWEISKVWKAAVNSLKNTFRDIAEFAISIGVYAVIWIPVLLILWFIIHLFHRKK